MSRPRVLVLRAPGTNCDLETAFAFEEAGGFVQRIHINEMLERPQVIKECQILCLPGGFSYGDDVAAGRILANQIQHHLLDAITSFQDDRKLVIGICNGFQVLIKSGILLARGAEGSQATLTWNDSGRFEDRWVDLDTGGSKSVFLQGIDRLYLPVAHAEGKFVPRNEQIMQQLTQRGQVALTYANPVNSQANGQVRYPANPNGSYGNVAGITDESGLVFGLMPHPERFIDPTHHPRWTRVDNTDTLSGLRIFQNAIGYFS